MPTIGYREQKICIAFSLRNLPLVLGPETDMKRLVEHTRTNILLKYCRMVAADPLKGQCREILHNFFFN